MILIVNTCKEELHSLEFTAPIKDILKDNNIKFVTKHYSEIDDVNKFEKIIICGTSLKDNKFIDDVESFGWIKNTKKPILGICAGMQIIGLIFGGKLKKGTEIGFYSETFDNFLGLKGEEQVYHLHNNYVDFSGTGFEIASRNKIHQAVRMGNIYGVLFHPEVRQKNMIANFAALR